MDIKELKEYAEKVKNAVAILENAPPCPLHGREFLEICGECLEDVRCSKCDVIPCQCWNDE